jgi:hypothetical protein
MRHRPSLFNYGTSLIASNPHMLCDRIDAAPEIVAHGNPLVTTLDPLPVIGLTGFPPGAIGPTSLSLNFGVQLSKGEIDFSRGNVFALPPELHPLPSQHLAVHFRACAGIGCPSREVVLPGKLMHVDVVRERALAESAASLRAVAPIDVAFPGRVSTTLPTTKLECFCLDLFATAGCRITGVPGSQRIAPSLFCRNRATTLSARSCSTEAKYRALSTVTSATFTVRNINYPGIYVPLYKYPDLQNPSGIWNTLFNAKKEHPSVLFVVTVNPSSGPGQEKDPVYASAISELKKSGVEYILGYIPTDYSRQSPSRTIDELKTLIDKYRDWYPEVNGIMFDQMHADASQLAFYRARAACAYAGHGIRTRKPRRKIRRGVQADI